MLFFFFLRYARWLRLRLLFFFFFSFCFPPLCALFIFYKFFFFLLNILVLNARTVFTVLRILGIPEWLDCCLPTLMLVSLIHEKSYRWWLHSSNDDFLFFIFFFFLFAKIQTRLPSTAYAVQFSTWIKKTVHVARSCSFFSSSFWKQFQNTRTNYFFSCVRTSTLRAIRIRNEKKAKFYINDKSRDSPL